MDIGLKANLLLLLYRSIRFLQVLFLAYTILQWSISLHTILTGLISCIHYTSKTYHSIRFLQVLFLAYTILQWSISLHKLYDSYRSYFLHTLYVKDMTEWPSVSSQEGIVVRAEVSTIFTTPRSIHLSSYGSAVICIIIMFWLWLKCPWLQRSFTYKSKRFQNAVICAHYG